MRERVLTTAYTYPNVTTESLFVAKDRCDGRDPTLASTYAKRLAKLSYYGGRDATRQLIVLTDMLLMVYVLLGS